MSGRVLQGITYIFDLIFVGILILLPAHAYEWMRDLDPGLNQLPEDTLSDVRLGTTMIALLLVITLHIVNIVRSQQLGNRITNGTVAGALVIFWAWKFLV